MKKKIIFLADNHFLKNKVNYLFLENLKFLKKHYKIYIILLSNQSKSKISFNLNFSFKIISNKRDFDKQLGTLKPHILFNLIDENLSYLIKLKKKDFILATLQQGNIPFDVMKLSLNFFISNFFFFFKFDKLLRFIKQRIFSNKNNKGGQVDYDLFFCGSKNIYKNAIKDYPNSKIIETHGFDYEYFLTTKKRKLINTKDYFVFLDNGNLFDHPDIATEGRKKLVHKNYRRELNFFLDNISKIYNKKIIISAHPKTINKRRDIKKFFKNKKVIFGDTANLIKNCSKVFTHGTTAIGYAVLYKKPIVFLLSNEIKKLSWLYKMILSFSFETGSPIINISKSMNKIMTKNLISKINKQKYEEYLYKYIYSKKSHKLMSDLIKSNLKKTIIYN